MRKLYKFFIKKDRPGKSTSNDADAHVEKNDGVSKGSGGDGQSAHESPSNDHRAAAKAVHQHAADGPCHRRKGEKKQPSDRQSALCSDAAHLRNPSHQGHQVRRRHSPALAAQPDSLGSRRDNVKRCARRSINN